MFRAVVKSYIKSLKGEEKLSIVILGWGVALYIISFFFAFILMYLAGLHFQTFSGFLNNDFLKYLISVPVGFIGPFGLVFVFIYPLTLVYSLYKCSSTRRDFVYSLTFGTLFLITHINYGPIKVMLSGSIFLLTISLTGCILGLATVITVITRTLKQIKSHKS